MSEEAAKKRVPRYEKLGYSRSVVVSALQKEIRRGRTEEALYWALLLYREDPEYVWKRVLITAAEDVGAADLAAVRTVCALAEAWRFCAGASKWGVSPHHLVLAVKVLCEAPKSCEVDDLKNLVNDRINRGVRLPVLPEYVDVHTPEGKEAGKTVRDWYRDRHTTCGVPVNEVTRKLWAESPARDPHLGAEDCDQPSLEL